MVSVEWDMQVDMQRYSAPSIACRADRMPSALPVPTVFQNVLFSLALPEAAGASSHAGSLGHEITGVTCTALGAPITATVHLEGPCDDPDGATVEFSLDGSSWPPVQGRNSHRRVAALWSWTDSLCNDAHVVTRHHYIAYARLDDLMFNKRHWVIPPGIREASVRRRLQDAACHVRDRRAVRCSLVSMCLDGARAGQDYAHGKAVFQYDHTYEDEKHTTPYTVTGNINDILHHGRAIPGNPLDVVDEQDLFFSTEFFDDVANACGIKFAGTFSPLDGSAPPEVVHEAPSGADGVEDSGCVWQWPQGHCWQFSVQVLLKSDLTELEKNTWRGGRGDTYEDMEDILGYLCLGHVDADVIERFRKQSGTLEQGLWATLPRRAPASHLDPCYWIRNYNCKDKDKKPVLLNRSLTCLGCDWHFDRVLVEYQSATLCVGIIGQPMTYHMY